MAKRRAPPLPPLILSQQWPVIQATPGDRAHKPTGRSPGRNRWRQGRRWVARNSRRISRAGLKGFLLSELSLGIGLGIAPAYLWWLEYGRFLAGLGIIGGIGILMGSDAALLTLMVIGEVQAIRAVPTHLVLAAALLLAPLAARVVWEWLLALFGR